MLRSSIFALKELLAIYWADLVLLILHVLHIALVVDLRVVGAIAVKFAIAEDESNSGLDKFTLNN